MVTDGHQTNGGDHFEMCRNIKPVCCVPGTNIVFQVNYTSKPNSQKKKSDLWLPGAKGWGKWEDIGQRVQIPGIR